MVFNKWLCNIPFEESIPFAISLTSEEQELLEGLLLSVNQRWKPLQNSGIEALRKNLFTKTRYS